MEDVLEVYKRQYDPKRPQICMDETSKQLFDEIRQSLPARVGSVEKFDCEYQREGVANLFMFLEALTGKRYVSVTEHRTRKDWAIAMKELADVIYPDAEKIVIVMDNLNTHSLASFYEAFDPAEALRLANRFEVHYTPKHGSWLNMAEIEFSVLSRQCLDRRIPDQISLAKEINAWQNDRNDLSVKVIWRFTTADARIKLKHLYPHFQV